MARKHNLKQNCMTFAALVSTSKFDQDCQEQLESYRLTPREDRVCLDPVLERKYTLYYGFRASCPIFFEIESFFQFTVSPSI